jgi:hypothetical protein
VNEFRLGLEKRTLIVASSDLLGSEAEARTMILETMQSRDERVVLHALAQTEEAKEPSLVSYFTSLLSHPSLQVVATSLRNLRRHHGPQVLQAAENLAKSASPEIRREALQYLLEHSPDKLEQLRRLLAEADPRLRAVTIALALSGDIPGAEAALDAAMLDSLFEQTSQEAEMARRALARSLGRFEMQYRRGDLPRLLRDPKASVVSAAMIAAARLRLLEHVPLMLEGLDSPHTRHAARAALALCGENVVPHLSKILNDRTQSLTVRARIPKILGMISSRSAVDNLLAAFPHAENLAKAQILYALDDLRRADSASSRRAAPRENLKFPADKITEILLDQAGQAFRLAAISRTLAAGRALNGRAVEERPSEERATQGRATQGRAGKLLLRTLREQWEQRRRWVVLLLGLLYDREDMEGVYRGLRSTQPRVRAHAIEFLDNLLKGETKSYVFPLIDDIALENVADEGEKLLPLKIQNTEQAYAALFELNHPWLSACALHALAEAGTVDLTLIEKFKNNSHPVVREALKVVAVRPYTSSPTRKENGVES